MKLRVLVVVVFLVLGIFGTPHANAKQPPPAPVVATAPLPAKLDPADHWHFKAVVLEMRMAEDRVKLAQLEVDRLRAMQQELATALSAKYRLGPRDTYDESTFVITRKPDVAAPGPGRLPAPPKAEPSAPPPPAKAAPTPSKGH